MDFLAAVGAGVEVSDDPVEPDEGVDGALSPDAVDSVLFAPAAIGVC